MTVNVTRLDSMHSFCSTLLRPVISFFYFVIHSQDDIGISGVVGSAVFNITLVIAVCALSAKEAISLNWYSVCRYIHILVRAALCRQCLTAVGHYFR